MVKKNRISSDALLKKKSLQGVKKPNPFEIQTSKTKFNVLNRDTQTNRQTGLSGVQRARAIEKRKQTLGQEYLQKHKSNRFVDQRRDGRNWNRDELTAERKSGASRRKEMYNLNDSVKLTHRGQTLEEIERFDDAVDNDNDSDDDEGQLDAEFMEAAHFGGGEADSGRDRKTVIEEMIAESKRKKAEKQRENDEVYEMTQKLDQNWQSLAAVVGDHMKGDSERPKLDDYDKVMREMIFERRGKPADKLKSAAELAEIEREKKERLERERLARMAGEENGTKAKHRSADDLDEGYFLQPIDGRSEGPAGVEENGDDTSAYDPRNITKEAEIGQSGSEGEDSDGSDETDEDNLSDLVEDSEEDEPESKEIIASKATEEQNKLYLAQQKEREKAAAEVPLAFEMPKSYEELSSLLNHYPPIKRAIVFERILSSNNGRAVHLNKSRMISLFAFAVQYLNDCFSNTLLPSTVSEAFETLSGLTPFLYDLAKMNSRETATCFQDVIKEKQEEFRKRPRQFPPLDTLVFFKLVPLLFSASDFRHPVVSPALVFLSEILSRSQVRDRRDITAGMFLVTVALECTEQSDRILPAALNFLNGVIYMCSETRAIQVVKIVPPFKSFAPWCNLLVVEDKIQDAGATDFSLRAEDFVTATIDESFKLRVLNTALGMIRGICSKLSKLDGVHHITANFLPHLRRIDDELYPEALQNAIADTRQALQTLHDKPLHYLVAPEKKPKPLRLLEPKIETTYEDIRRRPTKSQTLSVRDQRRKLQQKVKKETRAAAREIRQDNEFLAKMRLHQRVASDRDRREKVKRIFSEATAQQGELKSYDRKAKYKK
uniref:Putative nucleolar protein 14 n=1 Tax=Culex tarsalis TaxID=7177 RepID=A0A1Q3EXR4_CULTA